MIDLGINETRLCLSERLDLYCLILGKSSLKIADFHWILRFLRKFSL